MNLNTLAKNYERLTVQERFALILQAGARADWAEQKRLTAAGGKLQLSMPDHSPFARAFDDLSKPLFMKLVELALDHRETIALAADYSEDESETANDGETVADRMWQLALHKGFLLKTKSDGWIRFCERLAIPSVALWKHLPGFERLQDALRFVTGASSADASRP